MSLSKSDLFFALWYKLTQSGVNVERVDDHSYVIQVNLYDEPVTTMLVDRRVGSTYDMMNAVITLTFWDYGQILLDDGYIEDAISEDVTNLREAVDWVEYNCPSEITNLTYHLKSERDADGTGPRHSRYGTSDGNRLFKNRGLSATGLHKS